MEVPWTSSNLQREAYIISKFGQYDFHIFRNNLRLKLDLFDKNNLHIN